VAPGHCLTPMPMAFDSPEVLAKKAESVPFKRYGQPEEMGYAIAYLCSPEADFVTGQVISPNGGYLMVGC
jgi:3-oxoacyl-[acyl-carrier protein] reductase